MTDADETLGLFYEDYLPLQWRTVAEETTALAMPRLNESNDEAMRFIAALDEYPSEALDESAPYTQELVRVETKLNLLLGLVGQLMTVHFPLPPAKAIKLSPGGVEWTEDEELLPGDCGLVEIYLSDRCPRPLIFPGKIERVEAGPDTRRVHVQFTGLSEAIRERLEKIIFRHHRRRVALARRRVSPETDKSLTTKF